MLGELRIHFQWGACQSSETTSQRNRSSFASKKNVGDFVQNWGTPDIQLSMVSCSFPPQRSKKVEAHHVLFGPWQSKSQNCLISKPNSQFSLHPNISKAMSCSPFPLSKTAVAAVAQARNPRGRGGRTDAVENHGEDAAGGGRWESLGLLEPTCRMGPPSYKWVYKPWNKPY